MPTPLDVASGTAQRRVVGSIPTPLDLAGGAAQRKRTVEAKPAQPKQADRKLQSSLLTSADALDIYRRHRLAAASEDSNDAISDLFRESHARYGISKSGLRKLVASDKLRRLAAGEARTEPTTGDAERILGREKPSVEMQAPLSVPRPTVAAKPKSGEAGVKSRPAPIRPKDALDIARQYQLAEASENPSKAIEELSAECNAKYGLSAAGLRRIVARHKGRLPAQPNRHDAKSSARNQAKVEASPVVGGAGTVKSSLNSDAAAINRPRSRISGLPPKSATVDLEGVADIAAGRRDLHDNRERILECLQQLALNRPDAYGYLAWRYAEIRPEYTEARLATAHQDLIALAVVIDQERRLLDALVRDHGSILTKPDLARSGLEREYNRLISTERGQRSVDAELRRTRAAIDFIRRAIVLTIAGTDNDQRLWEILGRIRSFTSQRVETSMRLEGATKRLINQIETIERLLSSDDASLAQFSLQSRGHLAALQLKRYDFLRPFRDSAVGLRALARQATPDLAFQVLPQGEQLRKFLGGVRASQRYRGYRIDEHRLTVLEDLQKHFGAHRCVWHRGSESAEGIGIRYLVLAIKSTNGSGEHAVAISPLAGRHATYVVRRECAEADWKDLFARPKFEARLLGARKLLFTASHGKVDQYSAMRDKIIKLLECDPREFR